MHSNNFKYLPPIDHIRAIAALLVLVYHGLHLFSWKEIYGNLVMPQTWHISPNPLATIIIEGHTGVALFMVLSGFIFTYGIKDNEINYKEFLRNRFLRIYPLFVFLTVIGIYIHPNNFTLNGLFQTLLLFANVSGANDLGAFSALFWTISVEFQFYIIFPFVLRFLKQDNIVKQTCCLLLLALFCRWLGVNLGANARDISYWTILGRIDQFIIGMVAARYFYQHEVTKNIKYLIVSILIIVATLFTFNQFGGWLNAASWKIIWPTIEGAVWAFFIVNYIRNSSGFNERVSRMLCFIGERSFSIYIIHFVLLSLLCDKGWVIHLTGYPEINALLSSFLILFPVTLVVSSLTYYCIEKPFLHLRRRYIID